jgi:methylenetetrahydrofolate dehydrogenase (NADP+)/methenyltetrahydrofolate cyclohydrolase
MAQILDGKALSKNIINELKQEIADLKTHNNRTPGLSVILVGDDVASSIYVNKKKKTCESIGIKSYVKTYDSNISESFLINEILTLNNDVNVDGILIQLPLPNHINQLNVINSVKPDKDVDGFHPLNIGNLLLGYNTLIPCTPLGIIKLLEYYNIDIKSKHVVIVGRSNIVGKPLIPLFLQKDATVSICHSKTNNLSDITKTADILVAAIGKPNFLNVEYIKKGAVVIDVGINRVNGKIVGDVFFDAVKDIVSYITPVPGGVGPMTIAMLMYNTLKAYRMHL